MWKLILNRQRNLACTISRNVLSNSFPSSRPRAPASTKFGKLSIPKGGIAIKKYDTSNQTYLLYNISLKILIEFDRRIPERRRRRQAKESRVETALSRFFYVSVVPRLSKSFCSLNSVCFIATPSIIHPSRIQVLLWWRKDGFFILTTCQTNKIVSA